jgi:hypothetical protein
MFLGLLSTDGSSLHVIALRQLTGADAGPTVGDWKRWAERFDRLALLASFVSRSGERGV